MTVPERPTPKSYDEIVRRTVPDPDGSIRPTEEQEEVARKGYHHLDAHELALRRQVVDALEDALRASNTEWSFEVGVDRTTILLHGQVPDMATASRIEQIVEQVTGVESVDNRLVIGP